MSISAGHVLGIHTVTRTFKKPEDVIELAMVNGAGEILFHEYFNPPKRKTQSTSISKRRKAKLEQDCPSIADYSDILKSIVKDSKIIAAYPDYFHISALKQSGFDITPFHKRSVNVARLFADSFVEPDITDKYWEDDEGRLHKRKLGTHPSYVTMFDAALYFPSIFSSLEMGDAHDALWGAAVSAFLFIEMSSRGVRGTTRNPLYAPESYTLVDATNHYMHKRTTSANKTEKSAEADSLLIEVKSLGLDYVDKRQNNGCLWVIGDLEISPKIETLKERGFSFNYKSDGGKVTKGRPAWWTK